ncbi:MAG: DUF4249 domain-containing protein [Marinilabiliales bacterium]|nr:MAG: DUF4249 domain-containing protein [Marinilabiliales bacterium]
MSRAYIIMILIAGIFSMNGCKELYYPEIDPPAKIITVEGLITDGPGPYFVRLSNTSVYFSESLPEPVNDANVYVTANNGDIYMFTRTSRPGEYRSPSSLRGEAGNTYVLHIQTPEGDEYRSAPQTILPHQGISELLADSSYRTRTRVSNSGRLIIEDISGVNATLIIDETRKNQANIRFRSDVKVLYTYEGGSFLEPVRYYCWKELRRFEGLDNINLPSTSNRPGDVSNNVVAFMPFDKTEYRLDLSDVLHGLLIRVTLYTINNDTYNYYLNINRQLTSDETVFAPIPSQIDGNIISVSDPEKVATGFFEASAVTSSAFRLRLPPHRSNIFFEATDTYDDIPAAGCYANEMPPFWNN